MSLYLGERLLNIYLIAIHKSNISYFETHILELVSQQGGSAFAAEDHIAHGV